MKKKKKRAVEGQGRAKTTKRGGRRSPILGERVGKPAGVQSVLEREATRFAAEHPQPSAPAVAGVESPTGDVPTAPPRRKRRTKAEMAAMRSGAVEVDAAQKPVALAPHNPADGLAGDVVLHESLKRQKDDVDVQYRAVKGRLMMAVLLQGTQEAFTTLLEAGVNGQAATPWPYRVAIQVTPGRRTIPEDKLRETLLTKYNCPMDLVERIMADVVQEGAPSQTARVYRVSEADLDKADAGASPPASPTPPALSGDLTCP